MHKEVQARHFGASKKQMTLHTGCYYIAGKQKPFTFCGVSDSMQHDPSAVWAYLNPVLDEIKWNHPSVSKLIFFSDGPVTQYRQKNNFYLFTKQIVKKGFAEANWNFFEAGHGKGIPDGIGGTLKRTADRRVLEGADILSADDFIKNVQKHTKVSLYQIYQSDISVVEETIENSTLKTVPGTMRLHQIFFFLRRGANSHP